MPGGDNLREREPIKNSQTRYSVDEADNIPDFDGNSK